jgi:hypothetical protein
VNIIDIFCLASRLLSQVTNYHEYSKTFRVFLLNALVCLDGLAGVINRRLYTTDDSIPVHVVNYIRWKVFRHDLKISLCCNIFDV